MGRIRSWRRAYLAGWVIALGLGTAAAQAYTASYATPPGITLVDVTESGHQIPQFLWRRLGDASGNPLYTYDADQSGKSSCYDDCAKEFPAFAADAHAKASGDWSIVMRDDHVRQWAYQGKPLYRYAGKDPAGEPNGNAGAGGGVFGTTADLTRYDPSSKVFSPKAGWRRAAYTPEKSIATPPTVELDGLAIADGFGFVEAATHMTLYAAPPSHKLSTDWHPLRASALSVPVGDFSIVTRKDDGTRQWSYRGEALYTYAGDYAPGEVTGIFSGDKAVQAALAYQNFTPAGIEVRHYPLHGPLLTSKGMTLYSVARFFALYGGRETRAGYGISYNTAKAQGAQACLEDCTKTWKPVLAPVTAQAGGFWEIITRPDENRQWAFKGSPVYTFIGDSKPGDIDGNNRHVILYGGADGQIAYADAGGDGDPRSPQPLLGKIDMRFAIGGRNNGAAAAATPTPTAGVAAGAAAGGSRRDARAGAPAGQTAIAAAQGGGAGAGFYWHTLGLFY